MILHCLQGGKKVIDFARIETDYLLYAYIEVQQTASLNILLDVWRWVGLNALRLYTWVYCILIEIVTAVAVTAAVAAFVTAAVAGVVEK